jgi:hypothetical protein
MTFELPPRASARLFAALVLSVLLLPAACRTPEPASKSRAAAGPTATPAKAAAAPPEANILVDEPRLAKPYAVIGGTVQNVGGQKLAGLTVQIELRRRDDNSVERREAAVAPTDLAPGQQGKFALKVTADDWRSSSVVGLRAGEPAGDVAFKTMPGAKRPPERIPDEVINVRTPGDSKPKTRSGSDEFINTPDTPIKVP